MTQDDLILCAFRYCLGRAIYVVSDMITLLKDHWEEINPIYQSIILKETSDAVLRGTAGMDMDADLWNDLLDSVSDYKNIAKN